MNYTISEENYIKAIFRLQRAGKTVSTNALALELETKPASITDMLKKLKAKKLVLYSPYQGCRLSSEGSKLALSIVRRHRLWEYFLAEKLQFKWDEVHEVAEELEHVSSKQLIERLDAFLGFPRFDPHGDPIPDSTGKITMPELVKLITLRPCERARVSGLTDQSADMLKLLKQRKINIGTIVTINKKFEFDQSLEIEIPESIPFIISEQTAQNILVQYEPES
ncbi:MAG: metal-dependent transcriptional regulator [Bacteroidetes bacterium]|nr:metal-dependent transcriptional regulator [Bacteroidota bacterium]